MAHISRKVQNLHENKKKIEFINELGRGTKKKKKKAPLLGGTSHLLGDKVKCIDEKLAFMHYGA